MSNLLDKASILLSPTAYNNGSMLSVKPENGDGDVTFVRDSAATRVNAQGLVENVQILSSNLVTNGNFSQIGSEEVTNGNFSQEGTEQITNGDFSNGSTDWFLTNFSIINEKAVIDSSSQGSLIQTNVTEIGKTYRVEFTVSDYVEGRLRLREPFINNDLESNPSNGTYVYYGVADSTSFIIQSRFDGEDYKYKIDNVSVKEVLQDWTVLDYGAIAASASLSLDNGAVKILKTADRDWRSSFLNQSISYTNGSQYKVTFKIKDGNLTSPNIYLRNAFNQSSNTIKTNVPITSTFVEHTYYFTANSSSTDISIGNLDWNNQGIGEFFFVDDFSVKEVGQGFTFDDGWDVDQANSKASYDDTQTAFIITDNVLTIGKKYRVSLNLLNTGGNTIRISVNSETGGSFENYTDGDGLFTKEITSSTNYLRIGGGTSGVSFSVTNISVKEVTNDTNLPRINYEGFSYQDSLGSELITNGDFSNGSTGWVFQGEWSVLNNQATTTGVSLAPIRQSPLVNGTNKLTFDVVSGGAQIFTNYPTFSKKGEFATVGTHTIYLDSDGVGTKKYLYIYNNGAGNSATIDNVSVKEYLGQEIVPDSGCGSYLLENQSTNLIPYSSDFSQWDFGSYTTQNYALSPDGLMNASLLDTSIGGFVTQYIRYAITKSSSATHSLWVKASPTDSATHIRITNNNRALWNTGTSKKVALTDKWQRIDVVDGISGSVNFLIGARRDDNTLDPDCYGKSLIWGAQLEQQSYATSYIPTSGATNTRNQDLATNSGNATLINSTEGVLFAEVAALSNEAIYREISLSDGTTNNVVEIRYTPIANQFQFVVRNSGAAQVVTTITLSNALDFNKIAFSFKSNDYKMYVNGSEVGTDLSGTMPSGLNTLSLDWAGNNKFFGKNKALAVYKEALTDANLRSLTYPPAVATTFDLNFKTIAEQFTFTRGSEATFVNAKGLIESTNQLGSELVVNGNFELNSNWNNFGTPTTSEQSTEQSYIGNYSWKVITDTTREGIFSPNNFNLISGRTYTVSLWIYSVSGNSIQSGLTNTNAFVFTERIVTVGEWTNITYQATATSTGASYISILSNSSLNFFIDNVSVKEFTTATNTPRLDYSTGAEAFLLEPQSTNLVPYSQDFSQSSWSKSGVTITSDDAISPDGTQNADLLKGSTSLSRHNIIKTFANTNVSANISFFAKAKELRYMQLACQNTANQYANFDIQNGVVGAVGSDFSDAKIEDYGNGWYRCSAVSTNRYTTVWVSLISGLNGGWLESWAMPNNTDGIYIWGAQVEEKSFSTSLIPTSGATATRNQETCANATPVINSTEGTLYAEVAALANDGTNRRISLAKDGDNKINLVLSTASNTIQSIVIVQGAVKFNDSFVISDTTQFFKVALKYKQNDFALWVNGVEVATDTSGNTFQIGELINLTFDNGNGNNKFFGNTKGLKYYPEALADVQLEDLTKI